MKAKENRPDACTASGTAKSIYKYFSTDATDIQDETGWLFLPEDCALIINFIRTLPTFIRTCADECGNPIP